MERPALSASSMVVCVQDPVEPHIDLGYARRHIRHNGCRRNRIDTIHFERTSFIRRMWRRNAIMAVVVRRRGVPRGSDVAGVITKEHVADSVADSVKAYPQWARPAAQYSSVDEIQSKVADIALERVGPLQRCAID